MKLVLETFIRHAWTVDSVGCIIDIQDGSSFEIKRRGGRYQIARSTWFADFMDTMYVELRTKDRFEFLTKIFGQYIIY